MNSLLLIFHMRQARAKARTLAIAEALALLADCGAEVLSGGPLSEQGGVFWLTIAGDDLDIAQSRFRHLGYAEQVETLEIIPEGSYQPKNSDHVRWKKAAYQRVILYSADADDLRERAPDRREFVLETDGELRAVKGYRGDGTALGKRGLPVIDARLLVNLVVAPRPHPPTPSPLHREGEKTAEPGNTIDTSSNVLLLDPFAGIGGIVLEALASGCRVLSVDSDPVLRHGLVVMGAAHGVADAASLPYADGALDAVATEPPYEPDVIGVVCTALGEMARVVKVNGKIAMLCAQYQAGALRAKAAELPLHTLLDEPLDRKGTACQVLVWRRQGSLE